MKRFEAAFLAVFLAACGGGSAKSSAPSTPAVSTSRGAIAFSAWTGKTQTPETVTITNGGPGTLAAPSATVEYVGSSGWLAATVTGTSAPYTLTVTANPGSLQPGSYSATIRLTSAGATSATVSAALTVTHSWTIFVYGNADHNLTPSLLTDMLEMGEATLAPNINVIVLADYCAGLTDGAGQPYKIPWTNQAVTTGAEWYRIRGGSQAPQLIGTEAELNMDDPAILRAAVSSVFSSFPADRYGVVLWDHGGSWNGGFGGDQSDNPNARGTGMKANVLAAAVANGLGDAGVSGTRPLEFLAFDTCLMAANETAYEFKDLAKTYLACAEIDYGNGWNYAPTLSWLSNNATATATAFATNEVTYWEQQHSAGRSDQLTRSHIGLDTSKFATYADRWMNLMTAIGASTTLDLLEVARKQYVLAPNYWFSGDPLSTSGKRDAGMFLTQAATLTSDSAVASAAATANAALTDATLGLSQGSLRAAAGQKGVHFEMPIAKDWTAEATAYKALAWDSHTHWSVLMDALAASADATAPTLVTSTINATNPSAAALPKVYFGSSATDVAEARGYIAQPSGGSLFFYGVLAQAYATPGSAYVLTWSGKLTQLTDGTHVSPITLLPWIGGASPVYIVPGSLSFQGTSYETLAAVDGSTSQVIALFVQTGSQTATISVSSAAGATFTPAVIDFGTSTTVPGTALTIPTSSPALTAVNLSAPAGSWAVLTAMGDVWGNWGSAADTFTITTPF